MALFDKKVDWYDFLVPGSQIPAMFGAYEGAAGKVGDMMNDVSGTSANNQFNASEAQKQRDWETYMSNTQYQRAVADMKTAGLNPAMMYASGGQGASTPTGASATATRGHYIDLIGSTANLVNSINNARRIDTISGTNELTGSNAKKLYRATASIEKMLAKWLT